MPHAHKLFVEIPIRQTNKNEPYFIPVIPERAPNFLIEDAMQETAEEMSRRDETTLELVEADAGIKHAHRPRPLGEVAMVGVVQRRPHEVAHLRNPQIIHTPHHHGNRRREISLRYRRMETKKEMAFITRMGLPPARIPDENSAAVTHRAHSAPRRSAGACAENAGAIVEAAAAGRRECPFLPFRNR